MMLLILLVAACHRPSAGPSIPGPPRGLRYEGMPEGYKELAGILLTDSMPNRTSALSWVRGTHGEQLWLQKKIGANAPGHPRWELRA